MSRGALAIFLVLLACVPLAAGEASGKTPSPPSRLDVLDVQMEISKKNHSFYRLSPGVVGDMLTPVDYAGELVIRLEVLRKDTPQAVNFHMELPMRDSQSGASSSFNTGYMAVKGTGVLYARYDIRQRWDKPSEGKDHKWQRMAAGLGPLFTVCRLGNTPTDVDPFLARLTISIVRPGEKYAEPGPLVGVSNPAQLQGPLAPLGTAIAQGAWGKAWALAEGLGGKPAPPLAADGRGRRGQDAVARPAPPAVDAGSVLDALSAHATRALTEIDALAASDRATAAKRARDEAKRFAGTPLARDFADRAAKFTATR